MSQQRDPVQDRHDVEKKKKHGTHYRLPRANSIRTRFMVRFFLVKYLYTLKDAIELQNPVDVCRRWYSESTGVVNNQNRDSIRSTCAVCICSSRVRVIYRAKIIVDNCPRSYVSYSGSVASKRDGGGGVTETAECREPAEAQCGAATTVGFPRIRSVCTRPLEEAEQYS